MDNKCLKNEEKTASSSYPPRIESEKAKNKLVDGLSNLAPLLGFIDSLYKI